MAERMEELSRKLHMLLPGHGACTGCGGSLSFSHFLEALVPRKQIIAISASCWTINIGRFPNSAGHGKVNFYLSLFASAAPEAAAISDVWRRLRGRKDVLTISWCGDGATFDIGFRAVSAAAERNDDILYVLNDNEAYMNTGIQKSGATPHGAWTTTTPAMHPGKKKDIDLIMADHHIPYLATAALGSIPLVENFYRKVRKTADIEGFRFIHILNPCPPGWKSTSEKNVEISELAVATKVFPIVECENGQWRITYRPRKFIDIEEYLKLQGRFTQLTQEDIRYIRENTEECYAHFEKLAA